MEDWLEELLQWRNEDYYLKQVAKTHKRPARATIPDLKDNEFWDKGETTQ